ncbi:hypothetical protein [Halopelagius fulvigenes]|uniref:Uncharacterized protein n=1 Tax=Halopelagius fulvigenes TaxID=1198324 RepID=A0ABD5TTI2_9EURY
MTRETRCLRCSTTFDYDDGECPSCGWSSSEFRERGRYGLSRTTHGEPDADGSERTATGPDADG